MLTMYTPSIIIRLIRVTIRREVPVPPLKRIHEAWSRLLRNRKEFTHGKLHRGVKEEQKGRSRTKNKKEVHCWWRSQSICTCTGLKTEGISLKWGVWAQWVRLPFGPSGHQLVNSHTSKFNRISNAKLVRKLPLDKLDWISWDQD